MDEAEFKTLYRQQWPVLMGHLVLLCRDETEAADCVQEAFVKAWQHRRSLHADAGGWLRTVAVRVAVSRWRRRRTSATAWLREGTRRSGAAQDAAEPLDTRSPVVRELMALPRDQRDVVVMHHVMDMSVAQIADLVGVSDGTVKARLSRGRAAIRKQIDQAGPPAVAGTEGRTR